MKYVFALVVAVLAGYVVYDYRNQPADKPAPGEVRAFQTSRDQVTRFTLTRAQPDQAETIALKRENDEWKLIQPIEDDAEETTVDGFLFTLEMERLREFRDADDTQAPDWARFGLDHPGVTIEWVTPKGTEKVEISAKNAFDGSFYVRQGERLLLGQPGLAQTTNRSVGSFRSRRIWRHADADVRTVEARFADRTQNFSLNHDAHGWTLSPKSKVATDPVKIDKWVNAVEDLTAADFVKDGVAAADLKTYGLDHPRATIDLAYQAGNDKPGRWTLTIGPEKNGDVYFYTNDRAVILKTAAPTVRKLLVDAEYFRDGHLPFQFDVERAREVRVNVGGTERVIKKADVKWTLADAKDGEVIDEAELTELIANARGLEAIDSSAKPVPPKSAADFEVRDGEGKTLLALTFGDAYAPRAVYNQGAELRAVRVTNAAGAATFGLPKAQIDTLIKGRLIKKASTGG